jgi:glycine/D-amino acid oxidase-like deaminating enzyme/nitrite reductase/ring-hydroxylating ferredoxin subunit
MHILSPWLDTTPAGPTHPALDHDLDVDVCIVGAGITGLSAALALSESGLTSAVLEMDRIGAGVTGYTTAKVTALHGQIYDELRSGHGAEGARVYAEANAAAIELMEKWARELNIDCDWARRTAFTYTEDESMVASLEKEVAAAREAGLDASLVTETDLPYPVAAAIRLDDQAEFHPRKYLLGLAEALTGRGVQIFEKTIATGVSEGSDGCTVSVEGGKVTCRHVIVASHYPFLDRALFFARLSAMRSYAIGVHVDGPLPQGMSISIDSPTRSIRSHGDLLIVGGESHKTGEDKDTERRYEALESWARERFSVTEVKYHWSAHDNIPADGMPYIGSYTPHSKRLWTGTGFRKWGMTNGTAAGVLLADLVQGRENPWSDVFNPNRVKPIASAKRLVKENVKVAMHFFGDRLNRGDFMSLDELAPGQGGLVNVDGEKVGAYRREDGAVDAVKPICTHVGCHLTWNTAETTWDCPCHGSRFRTTGEVIQGPATKPLPKADV